MQIMMMNTKDLLAKNIYSYAPIINNFMGSKHLSGPLTILESLICLYNWARFALAGSGDQVGVWMGRNLHGNRVPVLNLSTQHYSSFCPQQCHFWCHSHTICYHSMTLHCIIEIQSKLLKPWDNSWNTESIQPCFR